MSYDDDTDPILTRRQKREQSAKRTLIVGCVAAAVLIFTAGFGIGRVTKVTASVGSMPAPTGAVGTPKITHSSGQYKFTDDGRVYDAEGREVDTSADEEWQKLQRMIQNLKRGPGNLPPPQR